MADAILLRIGTLCIRVVHSEGLWNMEQADVRVQALGAL